MKWNGDDSHTSTVRWFWAAPGAQPFPEPHRFGSLNWSRGAPGTNPFGEVIGSPRPWDAGATPIGILGTNFCGRPEWYRDGAPVLGSPIASRPDGQPACCAGQSGVMSPCCPGVGLPGELLVSFRNGDGTCQCLNGQTVQINYNGVTWGNPYLLCGRDGSMDLECVPGAPPLWALTSTGCDFVTYLVGAQRCLPLRIVWTNIRVLGCCSGRVDITIEGLPV